MEKRDNYAIQARQAKKHFLTYDQQELIRRCRLCHDESYFYITFLSSPHRICRISGDMERREGDVWADANGFSQVMVILDWLCDSRPDRSISGRWANIVSQNHSIHRDLQEEDDPFARLIDENPQAFQDACQALGGEELPGPDMGYAIELLDGLKVFLQFWHADEDFYPRLLCMWDENVLQYIRYETTWYAAGLLLSEIKSKMKCALECGQ